MKGPVAALLACLAAQAAHAESCRVVDATVGFWPLVGDTATLPPIAQAAAFRAAVIQKFPKLYARAVLGADPDQIDSQAAAALASARRNNAHARMIEWKLVQRIPDAVARFRRTFPDFGCDFPIYLMISLGRMDGAGREVDGRPSLVLGVDAIDGIETPDQLPVFLAHELFHRYHDHAAGFSDDPGDRQAIWRTLWAEGLATYVSARLNPDRPLSDALIFPPDLEARAAPMLARLARDLENNDGPDPKKYARFFEAGGKAGSDIPPRAGYYVGYRVAALAAQEYSLAELAHLHGGELHKAINRWLAMLADGKTD